MSHASTRMAAGRRETMGRLALLLFAGPWVILQNNARISDNLPQDAGLSLLQLPRASRVVEAGVLIGLFLLCQPRLVRARLGDFSVLVSIFLLGALVSMARTPTWFESQLQGMYVYAAPLLLFGWAVATHPTRRLLNRLIEMFSVYLVLCVAVALLVQLPVVRVKSDFIHGLFSDAHTFGAFLAIFSCVAFSRFMAVGGVRLLVLSVALFLVSYFPSNEKMVAFNLAWWAGVLGWRLIRHPNSRRGLMIGSFACAVVLWVAVVQTDYIADWFRVNEVTDRQILEQGPIQSWVRSASIVLGSPSALLVGIGPGNYAGIAAARAVEEVPARYRAMSGPAQAALLDATTLQKGAIGLQANTWSNLLAEFGVLGFLVFALALRRFAWPILRWRPVSPYDAFARTVFFAGFGAIVWQGFITPYTNWAEPVLVYPVIVVAAYCYNAAIDSSRSRAHAPAAASTPRTTVPA